MHSCRAAGRSPVIPEEEVPRGPVRRESPHATMDAERNRRIADLSAAYADVTTRRNHVYVDTFNPLQHHEQWRKDLAANHGHPGQAGYGLMAWLVLHRGWYDWLDLPEPR